MITLLKALALFTVTAVAEIAGCYLAFLWLREGKSAWLLVPAAASLALFAFLLTLHPAAAGRTYAAYGCVYVAAAICWLSAIQGVQPTAWDFAGAAVAIAGMGIIVLQPRCSGPRSTRLSHTTSAGESPHAVSSSDLGEQKDFGSSHTDLTAKPAPNLSL